jgi:4'-phosphopantetheinyl transferase
MVPLRLFAVDISNYRGERQTSAFLKFISPERKQKILKYRMEKDVHRSLISELLLRYLIINETKMINDDINFAYTDFGKPYLLNNQNNFLFNISHSGDLVTCATDDQTIGVDVEKVEDISLEIAYNYFSNIEKNELQKEENKIDKFFKLWTGKESYLKAIGLGLSVPLNSFSIRDGSSYNYVNHNNEIWMIKNYQIKAISRHWYQISICSKSTSFPNSITEVNLKTLLQFFRES